LLAGIAWLAVMWDANIKDQDFLWRVVGFPIISTAFCGIVYRLFRRPRMRMHFPIYLIAAAVNTGYDYQQGLIHTYTSVFPIFDIAVIFAMFVIPFVFLPTLPVYVVYEVLYARRFAQTTPQESDQP